MYHLLHLIKFSIVSLHLQHKVIFFIFEVYFVVQIMCNNDMPQIPVEIRYIQWCFTKHNISGKSIVS